MVPMDELEGRNTAASHRALVRAVAEGGMNMLRIWGGGIYQYDAFYDACDREGILVWQDFMFACAMYPGNDDFLENIRLEAEDNYNRLKKHTCIALWCGNNENLSAWKRWGWEENTIKEQTK